MYVIVKDKKMRLCKVSERCSVVAGDFVIGENWEKVGVGICLSNMFELPQDKDKQDAILKAFKLKEVPQETVYKVDEICEDLMGCKHIRVHSLNAVYVTKYM